MGFVLPDPVAVAQLMRRYYSDELAHFIDQLLTSWTEQRHRILSRVETMPQDKAAALATLLALFDLAIARGNPDA